MLRRGREGRRGERARASCVIVVGMGYRDRVNRRAGELLREKVDEILGEAANAVARHKVGRWDLVQFYPACRRVAD